MCYDNQKFDPRAAQNASYPKDDYFGIHTGTTEPLNPVDGEVIDLAADIADLASYARGFADAADLFASLIEGLRQ